MIRYGERGCCACLDLLVGTRGAADAVMVGLGTIGEKINKSCRTGRVFGSVVSILRRRCGKNIRYAARTLSPPLLLQLAIVTSLMAGREVGRLSHDTILGARLGLPLRTCLLYKCWFDMTRCLLITAVWRIELQTRQQLI